MLKNVKKCKKMFKNVKNLKRLRDGPTDGRTDRPTDLPTDRPRCRGVCTRLKMLLFENQEKITFFSLPIYDILRAAKTTQRWHEDQTSQGVEG